MRYYFDSENKDIVVALCFFYQTPSLVKFRYSHGLVMDKSQLKLPFLPRNKHEWLHLCVFVSIPNRYVTNLTKAMMHLS